MTLSLPVAACLAALLAGPPPGEPPVCREVAHYQMLPRPSAYRMASKAMAIVEGKVTAKGVVTVTRRFYVRPGDKIPARISVPALAAMPMVARPLGVPAAGAKLIEPTSVLLFLADNSRGDEWVPMHLSGKAARGVIWLAENKVWGYSQSINPGPYVLSRWTVARGEKQVLATPKGMRQAVATAVLARAKWAATLQVGDPAERAKALAKWFSPKTSPDGEWWAERIWPDLLQATDDVGEPMVKSLARLIRGRSPTRAVVAAVEAVGRLGERARLATPSLIARLRDLRGVRPIYLLRTLHRLKDARAVNVLRDYVAHSDLRVAAVAGGALRACGGDQVLELLIARVPKVIEGQGERNAVALLLELIRAIEPLAAERLVAQRFFDDAQLQARRAWLRQIGDRPALKAPGRKDQR